MNQNENIVSCHSGVEAGPGSISSDKGSSARPPRSLEKLNEEHIRSVDKFFRMFAGAASSLTGFHAGFIYLDIRIDDRLRLPMETIVRNIAKSWRREKELSGATGYCASIYQSARRSGFILRPDATPEQIEEATRRMNKPANEPDSFVKLIEEDFEIGELPSAGPATAPQGSRRSPVPVNPKFVRALDEQFATFLAKDPTIDPTAYVASRNDPDRRRPARAARQRLARLRPAGDINFIEIGEATSVQQGGLDCTL